MFLCLVLLVAPTLTAQATPDGQDGSDVPAFSALQPPSPKIRLHAQFADDDAFLTLRHGQLAGSLTPAYGVEQTAQVVFPAFVPLITRTDDDGRTFYGAPEVRAGWDARFVPDIPVTAEWRLGIVPQSTLEADGRPLLVLETAVQAIDEQGKARILAIDQTRVDPGLRQAGGLTVPVDLGFVAAPVHAGDRLVVTLDWHWVDVLGTVAVRPPLVTLHPGSWVDLPLEDTVRIEEVVERRVLDSLYVRAETAHLFSAANLDLASTNVFMAGPSGNTVGGEPVRQVDPAEAAAGRRASVDWRMPVPLDNMIAGDYDLYVTTRQVGEEAPRLIVHRPIGIGDHATDPVATLAGPGTLMLAAMLLVSFVVLPALLVSRRVFKATRPLDDHPTRPQ